MSDFSFKNLLKCEVLTTSPPIISHLTFVSFAIEKMFHKSVLTLLAVCLSATVCLAEDPSFPQAATGVECLKDQYIVQFEGAKFFDLAKQSIFKENEEVNLVRNIDSRNIGVLKFSDKKAAAKWRETTKGIKYFEAGENT